jgi:hypothetical protein
MDEKINLHLQAGQWPCTSWVTGGSLKCVGGISPASPLQEQGKYHPDTENIEHGVTEALHTTDGWVRKEKKPSSSSGPFLFGQWPCASWVTGGSLKHVGSSSPDSPLQEQGKYHPDTENTKTRCHRGFTYNKMEITSWFN